MKDCNSCKHFWYDNSTGTSECGQYDNMTEDETDKYYTNGEDNCPSYNENTNLEALIAKYEGYTKLNEEMSHVAGAVRKRGSIGRTL